MIIKYINLSFDEDTNDTDSVESYPDIASPDMLSPPCPSIPSPAHARSYGEAKKTKKDREPFYKGYGACIFQEI